MITGDTVVTYLVLFFSALYIFIKHY